MKRKFTFEGVPSGDCECFCWDVDRETYIRVTGMKPDKYDRGRTKGTYKLYPNDIVGFEVFERGTKLKVSVSIEGLKRKES
jgi:hypothetical protein